VTSTVTEVGANDGSFTATIGFTLSGDTFASVGVQTLGTKYTVANIPAGLTAVVTTTSPTAGTISFTGNASAHANINDVTNGTITFTNAAFTGGSASTVVGYSKTNITLDFIDQEIVYSGAGFIENTTNNGGVTGSLILTLSGAGWDTGLDAADVTFGNIPAGLTPVLTRDSATVATLTLTGTAAALDSQDADDVNNITFVFADTAFAGGVLATNVAGATGPASSNLGINFRDITLAYATTTFPEVIANNGTVTTTSAITLTGDIFTLATNGALFTPGTHFNATNVPAGMTLTITSVDTTHATVALTGTAAAHANLNDVADLTITWLNAAFTTAPAANITDYAKSNFIINFADPATIVYAGNFTEPTLNDGSVTGSRTATLTGDTFIASIVDGTDFTPTTHYTVANVPAGMTAVLTKTSPTVATLTLTGNAGTHTNAVDVANLTITFVDGVFTNTTNAIHVTNYSNAAGVIDFRDVTMTYSSGIFTESSALDGTISTTVTVTLTGDTFVTSGAPMTDGLEYTVANVPAGLTVVVTGTSTTTATIQLTGTAAAHAGANDVSDLTIAFTNAAFAATPAANITDSTKSNFVVDYGDAAIVYSGLGFSENANNGGGVSGSIIATITGATFADLDTNDILDVGSEIILGNIPAGLTPVITLSAGDTIATLTLTGNASLANSEDADDVANITFAFDNSGISGVSAIDTAGATGPASSGLGIDFRDVGIAYGTTTFPEVIANNGTISQTSSVILSGDTFILSLGNYTAGVHYTVSGVPAGMTLVISATTNASALISLTGTATTHTSAQDISNLTITWLNPAFTAAPATNIANYTKNDFAVDFHDPASIVWADNFTEALPNDGTITAGQTRTATLTGDTFTALLADLDPMVVNTHYTITNLPTGLTATLTKTSSTVATLTLTGSATAHAHTQDVANLTITFLNGAFDNTTTASDVTGYTNTTGSIDFMDPASIVWTGSFTEVLINNGTVTGSRVATITGDDFINAGGTLTEATHYIITGVPSGMTAAMAVSIGGDAATLTLTGTAASHLQADDVANLTVTFLNGAFVNTTLATNVLDYTNATGVVDFRDPGTASIAYSAAVFNESGLNNGTISNTLTLTLTGDTTFQDTDADNVLDVGTEVTVTNLPAGLTAAFALSAGDTVATLTLSGTAALHTAADSITDLTVSFADSAFALLPAASVTNATKADLAITYVNASTGALAYDVSTFTENVNNNGTITSSIVVTLSGGGAFAPTLTAGSHVVFFNAPTGLTGAVTRNSDTQATLTLTGTAVAHADANDIANYTVAFGDTAFAGGLLAANVTDALKSNITIDYRDITLSYGTTTFAESIANNGTIPTTSILTLAGDTFTSSVANAAVFTAGVHYTLANLPTGLTAVITRDTSTTATVSFTGTATDNLTNPSDVTNLTITWLSPAFTAAPASNIAGTTKSDFIIDFTNQASIAYAGSFSETTVNIGGVTGSRTATLTGDTFIASIVDGTDFTPTTHYTVANVPAGMTAVLTKTSSTVATLTLTGNASPHANANDVANLTITFANGVFTDTTLAANVAGYTNAAGVIDFRDVTLTYSASAFTESSTLDGSIGTTLTITLAGDAFTVPAAPMVEGVDYSILGLPSGLTAVVTGTSTTTATLTLTGNATSHANAHDVASGTITLTFLNAAFTATPASSITNFTKSDFTIDYGDALITYSGAGFTENITNDGGVTGSIIATLTGDDFEPLILDGSTFTAGVHYSLTGVPAGLTPVLTKTSATTATLTLTGNATTHTNAVDVTDIVFTWDNAAFDDVLAATVAGGVSASSLLGVNFQDTTLTYATTTFVEAAANNGTIPTTSVVTLANDTWTLPSGNFTDGVHYTTNIATIAPGLGMTISRTSATTALVTITGTLTANMSSPADVTNLTITWLDAAFTNVPVSRITDSTKSDFVIDYTAQPSIVYAGNFTESITNNGSVTGSRTATLTGDTFTGAVGIGATFTPTTHYTVANVPAGLTAVLTKTSSTVATLTLTGTATDNLTNPADVTNLTITFVDGAFTNTPLIVHVTGSSDTIGTIDFMNQASINYASNFTENAGTNNGTIDGSRVANLTGDTFINAGFTLSSGLHYTVANVPAGLTPVMTVSIGGDAATLTFVGTASPHTTAQNIANLTITFLNGAFTNTTIAANVINPSNALGTVTFIDAGTGSVAYSATTFTESGSNNGSITNTLTLTLTGDIWENDISVGNGVTVSNLPSNLVASVTRVNDTTLTLTLTGNALSHAHINDVPDLTVTLTDDAFDTLQGLNVTNAVKTDLVIDFADATTATLTYSGSTFTESTTNDGTVTNALVVTITGGGTFGSTLTAGSHVVFTGVPAGLTGVVTRNSSTQATLTLTGTAAAHVTDVTGVTVMFGDTAFSGVLAANVTNALKSDIAVDYRDVTMAYTNTTFTESTANNGAVTGALTVTLTGDTFVSPLGTLHALVSNVPAGLTPVITRVSPTVATIALTGNALVHADADDIANLTVTWQNGSFTNTTTANNATGSSFTSGIINYANQPSVAYLGSGFTESITNNGQLTDSILVQLTGDTYQDTDSDNLLDVGTEVIINNIPAGLTPVVALSAGDTIATLTLTGTATTHTDAADVADITFAFQNSAFTSTPAANIANATGPASSGRGINFRDITLAYDVDTFTESSALDGSVSTVITATLTGDVFTAGTFNAGDEYTVANVPSGLTLTVTRTSSTTATIALTGTASAHTNSADIANLGIVFANAAFTTAPAANITGSTKSNFVVDFGDATITYSGTGFVENTTNNGGVTGSIIATLNGATWAPGLSISDVTLTGIPAGLTAVLTRTSATVATLTLTGTASALDSENADDVSDITFVFANSALSGVTAANTSGATGPASSALGINFHDVILTYVGNFSESNANTGLINGSRVMTLAGDTFATGVTNGSPFTAVTHYTITNVPAGLTAVLTKTSPTVATLTLTGSATTHTDAVDVSNLTVTFTDAAFTTTPAIYVTGYADTVGSIDFRDVSLTYSSATFTEATLLNGSIGNTVTTTLVGDTFGATLTAGVDVLITNVPAGLTAVVTRGSATEAIISFTGTATTHTNAADIANLTVAFQDSAFVLTPASGVTGSTKSDFIVDFGDATLLYSGTGFSETASNTGIVSGSIIATLSGATFAPTLTAGANVTL
jgi:hypothetical protein